MITRRAKAYSSSGSVV